MPVDRCSRMFVAVCLVLSASVLLAETARGAPVGISVAIDRFFTGGRESKPRGPLQIREEWTLAQMRLSLPITSPDPLPDGATELRVVVNRGNDFGWNQTKRGENPRIRRFLVDSEHMTVEGEMRKALSRRLSVGARLPVQYRGAGFMDGLIDAWHTATGTASNIREAFYNDRYRIEGFLDNGERFSWNDSRGWGLGNVELDAHYAFAVPSSRKGLRAAVIGRARLPTGTGPFRADGVDLGLQVVAAKKVANRLDLYGGVGATWFSDPTLRGITYRTFRGNVFLALEWQVNSCWSFIIDTWYTSRLVKDILRYQEAQWYLDFGAKIDLSRNCMLEVGIIENFENQQTTVDFGIFVGLTWRW